MSTLPSSLMVAIRLPLGLNTAEWTEPVGLANMRSNRPVLTFQIFTFSLFSAVTICELSGLNAAEETRPGCLRVSFSRPVVAVHTFTIESREGKFENHFSARSSDTVTIHKLSGLNDTDETRPGCASLNSSCQLFASTTAISLSAKSVKRTTREPSGLTAAKRVGKNGRMRSNRHFPVSVSQIFISSRSFM